MKEKINVEESVKEVIIDQLNVIESEVIPTAKLGDDLGADSLDEVELVMELEEKFDIEIPDADVEKKKTVQEVIDYIKTRV